MPRALLFVLASLGIFAACDGTKSETPTVEAGVEAEGGIEKVECPKEKPIADTTCVLPEGTACDFGLCGSQIAVCKRGRWSFGGNPKPDPPCPSTPPSTTEGCPLCWREEKICPYPPTGCSSDNRISMARCVEDKWSFEVVACPFSDAGADVQGDADADGD